MDVDAGIQTATSVTDGIIQAGFGYILTIVVAVLAAFLIRGIVVSLESLQKSQAKRVTASPAPVQVAVEPEQSAVDETARHVAAIAAAVYAVVGAHRLVYIGEARPSIGWTTTGRAIHQTSHTPKRSPQR